MDVHRVNGLKFNFDRLSEDELESIHGHLLQGHARIVGEIALVETTLFERRHQQLPMDEPALEAYGEIADPEVWRQYIEATRDV